MKNSRPLPQLHSPLRWAKADREYTLDPVPALGERLTFHFHYHLRQFCE